MKNFFETYGAPLGALLGGIAAKIIDKILVKRSQTFLEATRLRDELRSENSTLRQQLEQLELDRNEWREKYYAVVESHIVELESHITDFESPSSGST